MQQGCYIRKEFNLFLNVSLEINITQDFLHLNSRMTFTFMDTCFNVTCPRFHGWSLPATASKKPILLKYYLTMLSLCCFFSSIIWFYHEMNEERLIEIMVTRAQYIFAQCQIHSVKIAITNFYIILIFLLNSIVQWIQRSFLRKFTF